MSKPYAQLICGDRCIDIDKTDDGYEYCSQEDVNGRLEMQHGSFSLEPDILARTIRWLLETTDSGMGGEK